MGGEGESKHELLLIVVLKEEQVVQQNVTSLPTGVLCLPSIRSNTKKKCSEKYFVRTGVICKVLRENKKSLEAHHL